MVMRYCTHPLFRAAIAHGKVSAAGGERIRRQHPQLLGNSTDGGSTAEVLEYAAGGEVIARKVVAGGEIACWLRADIADAAEAALEHAEAEIERVKAEVVDYARASRQSSRDQMAETYVLSSALLHAAVRRQATLGGLYDMDAHGDKIRGNLAAALDRAHKAESAK